jgi:hypothetical protein
VAGAKDVRLSGRQPCCSMGRRVESKKPSVVTGDIRMHVGAKCYGQYSSQAVSVPLGSHSVFSSFFFHSWLPRKADITATHHFIIQRTLVAVMQRRP